VRSISATILLFFKKTVFWGEKVQDPEQSKDKETQIKPPQATPKNRIQHKNPPDSKIRREFRTSGSARRLQAPTRTKWGWRIPKKRQKKNSQQNACRGILHIFLGD